jgi:hypothetical protein
MGLITPPRKKQIFMRSGRAAARQTYLRWKGIKWGRMEEAFEEGQGPHTAVKPVMMISLPMVWYLYKDMDHKTRKYQMLCGIKQSTMCSNEVTFLPILFLYAGNVCKWAVLLMVWRNLLLPPSGVQCVQWEYMACGGPCVAGVSEDRSGKDRQEGGEQT